MNSGEQSRIERTFDNQREQESVPEREQEELKTYVYANELLVGQTRSQTSDDAPFASNEERLPNSSLPLDCPGASPIRCSPVTGTFVDEYELVRKVGKGHVLAEIFPLELVAFNCDLCQLLRY